MRDSRDRAAHGSQASLIWPRPCWDGGTCHKTTYCGCYTLDGSCAGQRAASR